VHPSRPKGANPLPLVGNKSPQRRSTYTIFGTPVTLCAKFPNIQFDHFITSRYQIDEDGIGNTDFTIDAVLRKHIPDTLPIRGKRIRVSYPGIPALCNRCWRLGHAQFECKQPHKTNWLELVADFYGDEKHVSEDMLGTWTDALYKYHPTLASEPPVKYRSRLFVSQEKTRDIRYKIPKANTDVDDLRQQLQRTREILEKQERQLQRVTQPPAQSKERRRSPQFRDEGHATLRQRSPSTHRDTHHHPREGHYRPGGRGRGQNQSRGRGRGHGYFRGDPRINQ
jgi:hypothetical protein